MNKKFSSSKVFSQNKNGGFKKKVSFKKNDASNSKPYELRIKYYDCGERGHISPECPNKNKKKKFIKKVMMSTWSDNEDEESQQEDTRFDSNDDTCNFCAFITHLVEDVDSCEESEEVEEENDDEKNIYLSVAFEELYNESLKTKKENGNLKIQVKLL